MYARVSTYQFSADALESAAEQFDGAMNQLAGMKKAVLLADRGSGKAVTVTYWDSEEDMVQSRADADRVRGAAAQAASGSIMSVEEYEVLLER